MSQQILPSNNVQHDDNDKINCYGYIIDQCSIYTERIGIVMKKILCKSWPLLSKQSTRKRNKEVNIDFVISKTNDAFTYADFRTPPYLLF